MARNAGRGGGRRDAVPRRATTEESATGRWRRPGVLTGRFLGAKRAGDLKGVRRER